MAVEREGIAVDITANVGDFVGGMGQAVSSLSGFRLASVAAAGAAVGAFAVAGVQSFARYETSMENVRQLHQLSAGDLKALERDMRAFGRTTAGATTSQKDLANAVAAVADSSSAIGDSLQIAEVAAAMRRSQRAGTEDLIGNAVMLDTLLDMTGRSAVEAEHVSDVLLHTTRMYGGSVKALGADLIDTNEKAKLFGLTLEQNAALTGFMGKVAPTAQPSGLLKGLASLEDKDGPQSKELFKHIGVSSHDTSGKLKPMLELLEDIDVHLNAITTDAQEQARIVDLVFERNGAAVNAARLNYGGLGVAIDGVGNAVGELDMSVAGQDATAATDLERAKTIWTDFGAWAGGALLKIHNGYFDRVREFGEATRKWADDALGDDEDEDNPRVAIRKWLGGINEVIEGWSFETAFAGLALRLIQAIAKAFPKQDGEDDDDGENGPLGTVRGWLGRLNALIERWSFESVFVALGVRLARAVGKVGKAFSAQGWEDFKTGMRNLKAIFNTWVEDANTWLSMLGPNILLGIVDFSIDAWVKIKGYLDKIAANWAAWRAAHPWFDRMNGVGTDPLLGGSSVPSAAPAPPSASVTQSTAGIVINGPVNLPNVTNAQSFATELQALAREQEFTAQYRSLSGRRSIGR